MRRKLPLVLFRVMVGLFTIFEGVKAFLYTEADTTVQVVIGVPFQQYIGPIAAGLEIFCGAAILVSLYAGDAALLLLVVVGASLVATKIPILTGAAVGPFPPPKLPPYGSPVFLHEAWPELCMAAGALIVLLTSGLSFLQTKRKWQ
jgi:uncharacterized membrane protein YphA (DoxX/SURF4 family)